LSFQSVLKDVNTLLKSIMSVGYRWRRIVWAIGFWFKVDCYFTISLQLFATALYPAWYLDNGRGRRFSLVALVLCVKQILWVGLYYVWCPGMWRSL
jgi:hypothetical protein